MAQDHRAVLGAGLGTRIWCVSWRHSLTIRSCCRNRALYDAALEITRAYKLTGNFPVDPEIVLEGLGALGKVAVEDRSLLLLLSDRRHVAFRAADNVNANEFAAIVHTIKRRLGV